jgi:hypothetical protein
MDMAYPRTFYTDVNGLICKAFEAGFCQISRQIGFLGVDVIPSIPRMASKNGGSGMEENTVLTLLARNLTEPLCHVLGEWQSRRIDTTT